MSALRSAPLAAGALPSTPAPAESGVSRLRLRLLFDDWSLRAKLLVTPVVAMLAVALVYAAIMQNSRLETVSDTAIEDLAGRQMRESQDAIAAAGQLQAALWRFAMLNPGTPSVTALAPLADEIARRDADFAVALPALAEGVESASARAGLTGSFRTYRTAGAARLPALLLRPMQGLAVARDAAGALDQVIAALHRREQDVRARMQQEAAANRAYHARQRVLVQMAMFVAGPLTILFTVLVAHRIGDPIRRLTEATMRLAERQYDVAIPAIGQRDEIGCLARAVQVFKDAMQRADTVTREHQATHAFLDAVLEHVPTPIMVKDARERRYVFINRAAEMLIGHGRDHLIGRSIGDLLPPDVSAAMHERDFEALTTRQKLVDEGVEIPTLSNGRRVVTVTRIAIADPDGAARHLLVMVDDTTDRRQAERRIAHMAHHDALTNLPNRALFGERLREAFQRGRQVAVLGLDLDRFKEVNDTLGHAAGDMLLRGAAARMQSCLTESDILARMGGDEFAILQCEVRCLADAERLAERLIRAIRAPFDLAGSPALIGLSIGIALGGPGSDPDSLTRRADLALYEAKGAGRGCYRSFVPEMDARLVQRRALETDLQAALANGEISLHYQPQVDLGTRTIRGAEALMRWHSARHGIIPPSSFIPFAEDTGLIAPLGTWLLNTASHEAIRWPAHMHVAVNVSPVQLRRRDFPEIVQEALSASGLDPRRLELEVTEGVLLNDNAATLTNFAALRGMGVKLVLDDFGTGYASLGYLQKFRFDKVKIDRSFVKGLGLDSNAAAIVRAVIGLSHSLGMQTNAEGVETDAELEALRALDCTEGQGFHLWRPMTGTALHALLSTPASALAAALA